MTTIYYVDFEGSAGTGDGTSFANRAKNFDDLGNTSTYLADGDHEVRIKKSPKTNLGTGSVKFRGWWGRNGYNPIALQSSEQYWVFGTSAGQSGFRSDNHGLQTGDWIEIWHNKFYYTDSGDGNGSGAQQMGNLIGINGLWKVTCPDSNWVYLDQYVCETSKTSSESWSTGKINNSTHGYWYDVTGSTVEFPSNNPLPVKEICSHEQPTNRLKWTAGSNVTTYDPWISQQMWSSGTSWAAAGCMDKFEIASGASQNQKCAHLELPATLDLSGYQGVTFELSWRDGTNAVWQAASSTLHGQYSLRLCTDTAGATAAHTIPIDTRYVNRNYARGHVEWEAGGNMNNAIKSVAIYKEGTVATAVTFGISNVMAFKTGSDRITHGYKIGLNTTDDPWWYTIKAFYPNKHAIRLATCGKYYHQMYDEYGYYGGGLSCKWSQDRTNVNIYSLRSFRWGIFNDHNGYKNQNDTNESTPANIHARKFGNGASTTNLKKISGGWDSTNMTSQGSTDITWLDNGFANQQYGGVLDNNSNNSSQGARNQHWDRIGFSRTFFHTSGQYSKFSNMQFDCMYRVHLDMEYRQGCHIPQYTFTSNPSYILRNGSGNTQPESLSSAADNMMMIWGIDGTEQLYLGAARGTWSKITMQAGRMQWNNDNNPDQYPNRQNTTINFLDTGYYGREQEGMTVSYGRNLVIKDWHSLYNYMNINNDADLTIEDMNFDAGVAYTGITSTQNKGNYCLYWNSKNIKLEGGTSNRRMYILQTAKVQGWTCTDSEEHQLSSNDIEAYFADVNGVSGAGKYSRYQWNVQPETTIRHTNSGTAWKLTKTGSAAVPIFKLASVAVAGSGTVTVKVWVYRTVTGTDTYALLRIPTDKTLGINSSTEMNSTNGGANAWYELSVQATPTSAGIMDVELELVDSTNSGSIYFDDLTITQT